MTTLSAFLAKARAALAAPAAARGGRPLTFVVGNESADLDSLCSALVLAYFKSQQKLSPGASPSSSSSPSNYTLHIPLCHLAREDLTLRPEFTAILREAALTPDEVITLDDLPAKDTLKPEETQWVLVDHNVLTGKLAKTYSTSSGKNKEQGPVVVGCIDHHDDEGRLPPKEQCDPRVIEKSGSCMSLVVEHCKPIWEELSQRQQEQMEVKKKGQVLLNHQLAHLILGPILIDTANLQDKNKTTLHDTEAVEYLEETKIAPNKEENHVQEQEQTHKEQQQQQQQAIQGPQRYDREEYFNRISSLKDDLSQMSARDIFRKDYKEWTEAKLKLGTMSVPQPVAMLLEQTCNGDVPRLLRELESWSEEKGIDIASIMTASKDPVTGSFSRDLLVLARPGRENSARAEAAVRKFIRDNEDALKLHSWRDGKLDAGPPEEERQDRTGQTGGNGKKGEENEETKSSNGEGFRRCWTQGTLANSRKQVAPMLRQAMKGI